jgi:hypothetical protein
MMIVYSVDGILVLRVDYSGCGVTVRLVAGPEKGNDPYESPGE